MLGKFDDDTFGRAYMGACIGIDGIYIYDGKEHGDFILHAKFQGHVSHVSDVGRNRRGPAGLDGRRIDGTR
jgi:hypothetical protein